MSRPRIELRRSVLVFLAVVCTLAGGDLLARVALGVDVVSFVAKPSRPRADAPPSSQPISPPRDTPVDITCRDGDTTVTVSNGWHVNRDAPWKWDRGERVAMDDRSARFVGDACDGVVKAFVCDDAQQSCQGPIRVRVR